MSNIRSLEPQAHGLILLKTTFGDLELELFTQQCPKVTRNFTQLCLDGYYEGTIFDRVEKDFIAIGGKEVEADEDRAGLEFDIAPDEFHTRLKFSRRGLLATANTEKNHNGPAFFFTLGPTPELQNKHTIFGRVKGDSLYRLVDLNECPVDDDMLPISEKKIIQVIVAENPYPELERRAHFAQAVKESREKHESPREEPKGEERVFFKPKFDLKNAKKLSFYDDSDDEDGNSDGDSKEVDQFKRPFSRETREDKKGESEEAKPTEQSSLNETDSSKSSEDAREVRLREIKEQIRNFKKQLENQSATKIKTLSERRRSSQDQDRQQETMSESKASSSRQTNIEDSDTAVRELRLATKKGRQRERETLDLMDKFRKKLKDKTSYGGASSSKANQPQTSRSHSTLHDKKEEEEFDDEKQLGSALDLVDGDDWMRHKFDAESTEEVIAKDANTKGDDWYSIDDPRNPVAQRIEYEQARDYKNRSRRRDRYDEDDHDEDYERRHGDRRDERHNNRRDDRDRSQSRHRHHRSESGRHRHER